MQERPGDAPGGREEGSRNAPSDRPRPSLAHAEFAGVGLTLGLAIVLFAVAGNWLDERLGTRPLFVLLGVFLGFGGGFYHMYSRLVTGRGGRGGEDDGE